MKALTKALDRLLSLFRPEPDDPLNHYKRNDDLTHESKIVEKIIRHGEAPVSPQRVQKVDRAKRYLPFEFVPKLQANRNCRSYLSFLFWLKNRFKPKAKKADFVKGAPREEQHYDAWHKISKEKEALAKGRCKFCRRSSKAYGKQYDTDCHEVWGYNTTTKVQELLRLEALCVKCHGVKHLNQYDLSATNLPDHIKAKSATEFQNLLWRYSKINKISLEEATVDYKIALEEVAKLSGIKFTLSMPALKVPSFDCHTNEFEEFLDTFNDKD